MKKIVAIVLLLVLIICVFSGCVEKEVIPTPTPVPKVIIPTPTPTPPPAPRVEGIPTPTPTPTPIPTTTLKISPSDEDYYTTLVKTTLTMGDFNVTSAYVASGWGAGGTDSVLILGYVSSASTREELAGEIGSITHTFVDVVRDGWDIDTIHIAVGDGSGNITGTWYCEGSWVKDYLDGKNKRETLYTQIINTFIKTEFCHVLLTDLKDANCHSFEELLVF